MTGIFVGLAMLAVFLAPLIAYSIVWLTSDWRSTERPDPPQTNRPERTIPGNRSE